MFTVKAVRKNRFLLLLVLVCILFQARSQELSHRIGLSQSIQKSEFFLQAQYQLAYQKQLFTIEEGAGINRLFSGSYFRQEEVTWSILLVSREKFSVGPTLVISHNVLNFSNESPQARTLGEQIGIIGQVGQKWKWQGSVLFGVEQNWLRPLTYWNYLLKAKIGVVYAIN